MEIRRRQPEDPQARIAELERASADYRRMWIEAISRKGTILYCSICMAAFPNRNAREAATIVFGHAVCLWHWEDLLTNDGSLDDAVQDAVLHARAMVAQGKDPFA